VQKLLGDELQLMQFGGMPKDAKPFKSIGSGVLEIALRFASGAYRVVLALQIGNRIYFLHRHSAAFSFLLPSCRRPTVPFGFRGVQHGVGFCYETRTRAR
jgi:hypothetical protein